MKQRREKTCHTCKRVCRCIVSVFLSLIPYLAAEFVALLPTFFSITASGSKEKVTRQTLHNSYADKTLDVRHEDQPLQQIDTCTQHQHTRLHMLLLCICICACGCMNVCMQVCMQVCMHVHVSMHACIDACMHACMHACIHVCVRVCIHSDRQRHIGNEAHKHKHRHTHTHTHMHVHMYI